MGDLSYNEDYVHKGTPDRFQRNRGYPNNPGRKHRDWSQNEVYGSQYEDKAFEKIYLKDTSHFRKDKEQQSQFRKVKKTSHNYGQFYSPRNDYNGRVLYDINRELIPPSVPRLDRQYQVAGPNNPLNQAVNTVNPHALPPILTPRGSQTSREYTTYNRNLHYPQHGQNTYRSPRGPPSDSVISLPDVKKIEVQVTTGDNTLIVYPGRYGCDFSSARDGKTDFATPEVKEVNLKIENFDGSTYNLTTVPKRYDRM